MKITRPMQPTTAANAPGQRLDPAPLTSVRLMFVLGLLLAIAMLPEVARAQVQDSLTIQLDDHIYEIRGSGPRAGGIANHGFVRFGLDASVLAPRFVRPSQDRAGRSFGATFSISNPVGERPDLPRFATFDVRRDRPPLRFHPSDRVRVRPRPRPTQAIPEPHAALLFAAGIGIIASTTRRRR